MRSGRHVVTANKQLLSQHGEELWATAREHNVQLRFEAAVAGVVPVIRVLQESLAGAHVERLHGIVNGTTNFILTEMARTGMSYDEALAEAQRLGYAESDPSEDVDGRDAAAKMAILARLAFDTPVSLHQVRYEGIEEIAPDDLEYARDFGLGLKLIGTAERIDGGLSVRVHPAFLYGDHPLASVNGPFNAVTVESPAITEITMSGPGAGGPQTASAVLGDVISAMIPPASTPPTSGALDRGRHRVAPSTCTWRSPTAPACSPRWPTCWAATASRSSRSCRRGWARTPAWSWSCTPCWSRGSSRPWTASPSWTSCGPSRGRSA